MTIANAAGTDWTIAVHRAHKRYGENVLFRNLDLLISPGQALRIEGPNGSGKTQLLYSLCGLVPLDDGEISIASHAGRTAVTNSTYERDRILRFVPALPVDLNQLSVSEYAHVVSRRLRPYSLALRSRVVRASFDRQRPELEAAAGRTLDADLPVSHLSIGQQKRLTLAATVYCEKPPKVFAVDEPLAALDKPGVEQMIHLLLLARSRGVALIVAEHRPEINIVGFDQVISMPYGVGERNGQRGGLAVAPWVPEPASAAKCLSLRQIEAGYPQNLVHCDSLELSCGGVAIISGGNGAGKTGFLKALAGIRPATLAGDMHLGEKKVDSLAGAMRRSEVRYMAQDRDNFLELSTADAMRAACGGNDNCGEMVQHVLASVGRRKRVDALSSGHRALLLLAQTLVCRPRLALLDEPFANVDRSSRQDMLFLIEHARREFGTAFLIAEHGAMALPGAACYTLHRNATGTRLCRESSS